MAIYPGAVYKPTPHGGRVRRNRQGRGMLHVAVSSAKSLPPSSGITWHFYVAKAAPDGSTDGSGGPAYCEQYVDTDYRAYGGAEGNDDQIIVETAGGLGPSRELNAEKWTRAQELRIADLMRWEAGQPGGAPLELLPDARPGRRGWGPHRLGIKHSGGPRPGWWQPGSELWSNALGKECPGDAKVAQIPGIVALARASRTTLDQSEEDDTVKFHALRSDPASGGTGEVILAAPGTFRGVESMAYFDLLRGRGVCGEWVDCSPAELAYFRLFYLASEVNDEEIAAALAQLSADEAARAAAS